MFDLSFPEWAVSIQAGVHFDYAKYDDKHHVVSLYHEGKKQQSCRIEPRIGQSDQEAVTHAKEVLLYWWNKKVSSDWEETSPGHFKNLKASASG